MPGARGPGPAGVVGAVVPVVATPPVGAGPPVAPPPALVLPPAPPVPTLPPMLTSPPPLPAPEIRSSTISCASLRPAAAGSATAPSDGLGLADRRCDTRIALRDLVARDPDADPFGRALRVLDGGVDLFAAAARVLRGRDLVGVAAALDRLVARGFTGVRVDRLRGRDLRRRCRVSRRGAGRVR